MPSDVFWAAIIAGGAGLASNVPTYLVARSGHQVQRASIDAENQRLDEQHRQQERRERLVFQRESLIELQDWLAKLARAAGAMHHLDEIGYRESGRWGRDRLGEEINLRLHEAIVNVNRYRVRMLDDDVRSNAERFVALSVSATMGALQDQDDAAARSAAIQAERDGMTLSVTLNEQIRGLLRALV